MLRIIDGRRYNTATATLIADVSGPCQDRGNFRYDDTQLYRTPNGRFFLAGCGGPRSRWARSTGQNSWSGGEGIIPIDADEARELAERYAPVEVYEAEFGAAEAA